MKQIMVKRISMFVCIIMMFTMLMGTGSVFANGRDQGPPPLGNFQRIEPATTYLLTGETHTVRVPIIAVHENRSYTLDPSECVFTVDHPEVVEVQDGYIYAKSKGVATITIKAMGSQAQITVEVREKYIY